MKWNTSLGKISFFHRQSSNRRQKATAHSWIQYFTSEQLDASGTESRGRDDLGMIAGRGPIHGSFRGIARGKQDPCDRRSVVNGAVIAIKYGAYRVALNVRLGWAHNRSRVVPRPLSALLSTSDAIPRTFLVSHRPRARKNRGFPISVSDLPEDANPRSRSGNNDARWWDGPLTTWLRSCEQTARGDANNSSCLSRVHIHCYAARIKGTICVLVQQSTIAGI